MKTLVSVFSCLMLIALATAAFAFGPAAKTSDALKLPGMVATPSKSACQTIHAGRATSVSVNTTAAQFVSWTADDGAGTAVTVKRSFNSNTAAMPKSSETAVGIHPLTKTVVFTRYTGAANINLCTDLQ